MTVSSGFFNSVNHDRLYDAEQLSSIFDGLIKDGIYENIGDAFQISVNPEVNNSVLVGTGRAWFDHTWTVNDSVFSIQLVSPNEAMGRIDAIVLDVDREQDTRNNSIKYITGEYDLEPQKPSLIKSALHNQYPLAYINIPTGASSVISNANIENKIGSSDCPIVTGVLEALNLDLYTQQMEAEFYEWWDGIKDTLDENTVANILKRIDTLEDDVAELKNNSFDFTVVKQLSSANIRKIHSQTKNQREHAYLLPDGYVLFFRENSKMDVDVSGVNDGLRNIHMALMDRDGVLSNKQTIYGSSDYYHNVSRICVLGSSDDEYPVDVYIAYSTAKTDKSSGRYTSYKTLVDKITVTSDHILSRTNVYTDNNSSHVSDMNGSSFSSFLHLPVFPAKMLDGTRFFPSFNATDDGGLGYTSYSLTPDFTVSKKESYSEIRGIEDIGLHGDRIRAEEMVCFAFMHKDEIGYYVFFVGMIDNSPTDRSEGYLKFLINGKYSTMISDVNNSEFGSGIQSCKVLNRDDIAFIVNNVDFGKISNQNSVLVDSGYDYPAVLDYSTNGNGTITNSIKTDISGGSSTNTSISTSDMTKTGITILLPNKKNILTVYSKSSTYYMTYLAQSGSLGFESGGYSLGGIDQYINGFGRFSDFIGLLYTEKAIYVSDDAKHCTLLCNGCIDTAYSGRDQNYENNFIKNDTTFWGPFVVTIDLE